jgi:hypothetical protein
LTVLVFSYPRSVLCAGLINVAPQYPTESLFQPTERVYVCDIVDGREVFTGPFVIHEIVGNEMYHLADITTGQRVRDNVPGEKLRDRAQ